MMMLLVATLRWLARTSCGSLFCQYFVDSVNRKKRLLNAVVNLWLAGSNVTSWYLGATVCSFSSSRNETFC